jgi:RimJ/RimL family protein N-acetyltransferase
MSIISLETERLVIRTLTLNDVRSFFNYRSLNEVARFQTFKPKNLSDAITFIDSTSSEINVPNSWYQLGLFDKRNDKHIGDIGIHFLNNIDETEIGCTIAPNYWKKGYATEGLKTIIGFIFKILKKKRIIACISADNIPSRKLFKRLGFQLVSQDNSEDIIYQLTYKHWFVGGI